jgi:voltage-gated potassium channel
MVASEVRAVPLFAGMSPEALDAVAASDVFDVPAGQLLAEAGAAAEGMFVVLDGTVVAERGDLHIAMGPGSFFGELPLLVPDAHRIARVRATSEARLIVLDRATFDRLLDTEPAFARALLTELASRLVQARTGH